MTAQTATLTAASNIQWASSSVPFNGYVLLIMAPPSTGGAAWPRVHLRDVRPRLRVPTRVKVPIKEGVYDPHTSVWQTSALVPTQVLYASFFYDETDRLIANGPELFTITSTPYTLAPPTLTEPTAAVVAVGPEDVPTSGAANVRIRENLAGTKNSSNVTFTATAAPLNVEMVIWNGVVLQEGLGYTRSGVTYTMTIAPDSGDSLEVIRW